MPITLPIEPLIPATNLYSLDIRNVITGIKARGWVDIASALQQIQTSSNAIEKYLRDQSNNTFTNIIIKDSSGVIGWIGTFGPYSGAWFKRLWVGGDGPPTAPFFTDSDGSVYIGLNGSIEVQDIGGNEVGWIGVQSDASKVVTGATNATPIVVTIATHGYETGDTVFIASVGGNTAANGYRLITVLSVNTFSLQTLAGANVAGNGAYTSGGTCTRYFGGARFQTMAIGDSFTDYHLRMYADGQLKIKDALITLTDVANNGYIELNPSTGPEAIFRNTSTGEQINIVGGQIIGSNYLTAAGEVSIDFSGVRLYATDADPTVLIQTISNAGTIGVYDASGSQTIGLAGSTGIGSAFIFDASTEFRINGTPGIDNTITVPTSLSYNTASAVTSVDFALETTTSDTFVTDITFTDVIIEHEGGILTGAT